jgi:hypothetical protein
MKTSSLLIMLCSFFFLTSCLQVRTGERPAGAPLLDIDLSERPGQPEESPGSTANDPTAAPLQNPWPENGAKAVSVDLDLDWQQPLEGETVVVYDVFLEADDSTPDEYACEDTPVSLCDPAGLLAYNTRYYWQVVSIDGQGKERVSPIWHFSTAPDPTTPLFSDDFSSDKGWEDESDGHIQRDPDQEQLVWEVEGDPSYVYYMPVDIQPDWVKLTFRINLLAGGGNNHIFVGLVEKGRDVGADPSNRPGFYLSIGHDAGVGTYLHHHIIYADQPTEKLTPPEGCADITCTPQTAYLQPGPWGTWNNVALTITGNTWDVVLSDASGREIGRMSGITDATHDGYEGIILSSTILRTWEWLHGYVDDIQLYAAPQR